MRGAVGAHVGRVSSLAPSCSHQPARRIVTLTSVLPRSTKQSVTANLAKTTLQSGWKRFVHHHLVENNRAVFVPRRGFASSREPVAIDVMIDERRLDQLLEREATAFAMQPKERLVLAEILALSDPIQMAEFVHEEVPVRFAARVAQCETLDNWHEVEGIKLTRDKLMSSFKDLRLSDHRDMDAFTDAIKVIKDRHKHVVPLLAGGMREYQNRVNPEMTDKDVNSYLNKFFMDRVGIEMLTSQYLALFKSDTGIIDKLCDPTRVCKVAAEAAQVMARQVYPKVPMVSVDFYGPSELRTFSYVPTYLYYVVHELLKNAVRATIENYSGIGSMEPVRVSVCMDEHQLVVEVRDRGGGIPFEHQQKIFNYLFTTVPDQQQKLDFIMSAESEEQNQFTPLAGFGVGLPLSQLYATFLGGKLTIVPMPCYGTSAFLTLPRHAAEITEEKSD